MDLREQLNSIEEKLEAVKRHLDEVTSPPRLLSMAKAARHLGIGPTKMGELIRDRVIRTVKLGERRMIPLSELVRVTSLSSPAKGAPEPTTQVGRAGADEARARLAKI